MHLHNTRLLILWHLSDTPRPYFSRDRAKSLDLWEKVFQKLCVTGLTLSGSGKTLTSFKTAQLAADLPYIDKVLFVVDRKDLDYQTMKEYDRFEKGAADGNTSTKVLEYQLSDKDQNGNPHDYRIIITTIQKLANFVSKNKGHKVANQRIVIIFMNVIVPSLGRCIGRSRSSSSIIIYLDLPEHRSLPRMRRKREIRILPQLHSCLVALSTRRPESPVLRSILIQSSMPSMTKMSFRSALTMWIPCT